MSRKKSRNITQAKRFLLALAPRTDDAPTSHTAYKVVSHDLEGKKSMGARTVHSMTGGGYLLLLSLQFELPGGDLVGQARVQPRRVVLHRSQAGVVVGVGDVAPLGGLGGDARAVQVQRGVQPPCMEEKGGTQLI